MEKGHLIFISNIYKKHFKQCENFKDDMLQEGYLAIKKCEKNFNPTKGDFYAYAKKPVINAMTKVIIREKKKNEYVSSLNDSPFDNNEKTYTDILRDENDILKMVELNFSINYIIQNFNKTQQKIIREMICGYSQKEIAKNLKLSNQYVNYTIKRFRAELKLVI